MSQITMKRLCITALLAAAYAAATLSLPYIGYGVIQCRLSEALNMLIFINPAFAPGIILGCAISNLFSPVSPLLDTIFGTSATALAALGMIKLRRGAFTASLWPVGVNGVVIAAEICCVNGIPMLSWAAAAIAGSIAAGEFIAVSVLGYALARFVIMPNTRIRKFLEEM
ncbi:MAG: QueT transporter family protein [Clostridiales bacterium]|jgi:uncharacterized membrane protein|nr:QueT transporter family protein [Clostridiales bacterium]